jgi:hypothetical protein
VTVKEEKKEDHVDDVLMHRRLTVIRYQHFTIYGMQSHVEAVKLIIPFTINRCVVPYFSVSLIDRCRVSIRLSLTLS